MTITDRYFHTSDISGCAEMLLEDSPDTYLGVTVQESIEMVRSVIPANIEIRQNITGECLS
ncbi:hypothetical protein [Colwellia sp. 75C3]|uniref:hypothetical protein n=1 Tax=Colwellia sp. 75C3 TaxID=888425 RepID=UPI0012FF2DA6|nr:hypothetical protein [Colwellia sp. 75C3]